jgi:hypothetical protein
MSRNRRPPYSDPNDGRQLVYDKRTGEFREPIKGFVPTLPLDPIAEIRRIAPAALSVWMLCHFLHRCNRSQPFKINRHNAAIFGLSQHEKLAGLDALEKAGFINTDRNKGQGHLIQLTEKGLGYAR